MSLKTGLMSFLGRMLLVLAFVAFLAWSFAQPVYGSKEIFKDRITRFELSGNLPFWTLLIVGSGLDFHDPGGNFSLQRLFDFMAFLASRAIPSLATLVGVSFSAIILGRRLFRLIGFFPTLTRLESWLLTWAIGMPTLALLIQGLGLAGLLDARVLVPVLTGVVGFCLWRDGLREAVEPRTEPIRLLKKGTGSEQSHRLNREFASREVPVSLFQHAAVSSRRGGQWVVFLLAIPFFLLSLTTSFLLTPDFDAHAYHLLGPAEWHALGRISFLKHNVYTTFPFLTEMFSLLGMMLAGKEMGAILGQVILWSFGPMTAIALYAVGRRIGGDATGLWAALIYSTSAWTYRLSSIPYVEGPMLFFLSAGLLACVVDGKSLAGASVVGALAGAGFGCKYPALVMVGVPLAVGLVVQSRSRIALRGMLFAVGFLAFAGIWLVRNIVWTGNPIFPLLEPWFGHSHWTLEQYERFHRAHQSTDFSLGVMASFAQDIIVRSDWQSALLFAGVPFAFLSRSKRLALLLVMGIVFEFAVFFYGTHRLDRFFLAVVPLAAIASALGFVELWKQSLWPVIGSLTALVIAFNGLFCLTPFAGANFFLVKPLSQDRQVALRGVADSLLELDKRRPLPPHSKVLFVGVGAVFASPYPAVYNTVFDQSELFPLVYDGTPDQPIPISPAECRRRLQARGIDAILVDWHWVWTYGRPGNYGFPAFVDEALFRRLVQEKVLQLDGSLWTYPLFCVVKDEGAPQEPNASRLP